MFGMKFGGEKKPVAKVETNESLEGQIEQETMKLDANLESLKTEIDAMGGIEELSKKIIENKNSAEAGAMMGIMVPSLIAALPLIISLSPGGIDGFLEGVSGNTNDMVITITTKLS